MMMVFFKIVVVLVAIGLLQWMWLRVVNAEVKQDYRDILKDESLNSLGKKWHRQSFIKLFLLGVGMALPFGYLGWGIALSLLFLEGAEFWLLFDRNLSIARGLDPLYVGQTADFDTFFRRLFASGAGKAMLVTKVICLVLGGASLVYFLVNWVINKVNL